MCSFGLAWVFLEALASFFICRVFSVTLLIQKPLPTLRGHRSLGYGCRVGAVCVFAPLPHRERPHQSTSVFQLMTLRGSVLEDAIPSTAKHSTARGLPLKEVLEHVIPELNVQCLRLAFNTPKVTEQLMKLDEQGVSLVAGGKHSCCPDFQNTDLDISLLTRKTDTIYCQG